MMTRDEAAALGSCTLKKKKAVSRQLSKWWSWSRWALRRNTAREMLEGACTITKKSDSVVFLCLLFVFFLVSPLQEKGLCLFLSASPPPVHKPPLSKMVQCRQSQQEHWIQIIIKFIWDKNYDGTIVFFWVGATRMDLKNSISSEALGRSAPHSCKQNFKQAKNNLRLKHRHTPYQIYKAQRAKKLCT